MDHARQIIWDFDARLQIEHLPGTRLEEPGFCRLPSISRYSFVHFFKNC